MSELWYQDWQYGSVVIIFQWPLEVLQPKRPLAQKAFFPTDHNAKINTRNPWPKKRFTTIFLQQIFFFSQFAGKIYIFPAWRLGIVHCCCVSVFHRICRGMMARATCFMGHLMGKPKRFQRMYWVRNYTEMNGPPFWNPGGLDAQSRAISHRHISVMDAALHLMPSS